MKVSVSDFGAVLVKLEVPDQNGKLEKIPYKETANYVKKLEKANETYKRLYY